jgi:Family of unknown function (DUF6600)/FecR protein
MCSTPVRGLLRFLASCFIVVVGCATTAAPARAQDAPGHVTAVDGNAWIDGEVDTIDATPGEVVTAGDRIRTASGRVEVRFADGTALALDDETELEVQSPTLFRLTSGRLWLVVPRSASSLQSEARQIDTPLGSVVVREPGEYRVGMMSDARLVDLVVRRGTAELTTSGGAVLVRSGERATAHLDGPPSQPMRFNTARLDVFDDWVERHRDSARGRATSSQYLPADLRMYAGEFDQYGSWDYESSYGYVWYPAVDSGWRPYYNGYWRALPTYGWTWIGRDPWGWPTHHYGRWGYARSRWYWIPARHWAPAWVSWASAPSYVSWCPLGFDSRPVFGFSLSVGSTWAGWTVMSRGDFGRARIPVAQYAVAGGRLPRSVPFAVHSNAPILPPSIRNRPGGSVATSGWRSPQLDDAGRRAVRRNGDADGRRGPGADREVPVDPGVRAFRRDRIPAPVTVSPSPGQAPTRSGLEAPSTRSSSSPSSAFSESRLPVPGMERGVPRARRPADQVDPPGRSEGWRTRDERATPRADRGWRQTMPVPPSGNVNPATPAPDRPVPSPARGLASQAPSQPQGSPRAESRRAPSGESQSKSSENTGASGTRESGGGGGGVHRRRP